ncbi:lysozyme C II-like [Alosa pseudoharengus]|uniref:lysozyme C II-like n=1 Tax=Alosa pseudoharengus TaxID=34774 RepID=UPI003F8C0AE8
MRAVVLLLLVTVASAKVFERCELARKLKSAGMGGSLSDWVCLAKWESDYNTQAINRHNTDGSTDYGIFQINNNYWCKDPNFKSKANGCGISCSALLSDNIQPSINCAKRIASEQGMSAWVAWVKHCQGDTRSYIAGCGV